MPTKFNPDSPTEIATIASLFGFTTRRVNQILAAAGVERADRGLVPLKATVQACLASYRGELARRRARSADSERLVLARAHEVETRNTRTEARLIDVAEHREIAAETFARLRRLLASTPSAAGLDDTARARLTTDLDHASAEAERRFQMLTDEALSPSAREGR